jgi:hypothetical protein
LDLREKYLFEHAECEWVCLNSLWSAFSIDSRLDELLTEIPNSTKKHVDYSIYNDFPEQMPNVSS